MMPATLIAQRIVLLYPLTVLKDRVRELRPCSGHWTGLAHDLLAGAAGPGASCVCRRSISGSDPDSSARHRCW